MKNIGIFTDSSFLDHQTPFPHCESRKRIQGVLDHLQKTRLMEKVIFSGSVKQDFNALELVHSRKHIDHVRRKVESLRDSEIVPLNPQDISFKDGGTFVSRESFTAAKNASNIIIQSIEEVHNKRIHHGFCLVRPPGHHATNSNGMGFCLFNNVAIGAKYLQCLGYRKILIIDHDIHHGNGTQDIFYEDSSVFFFSSHHIHYSFGERGMGFENEKGEGKGLGFNRNVILKKGAGNSDLLYLYRHELSGVLRNFSPDIVLISAGFDLHKDDFLSETLIDDKGIEGMLEIILTLTENIPKIFILEGGYNIGVLKRNIHRTISMLLKS